jgi:hypothetical protein
MILTPAVIALVFGSFVVAAFALYASFLGFSISRKWDLSSGSEEQLHLERKTYLVTTIFAYLLVFELCSLFLFVHTADTLHPIFVGAMCAAGSLNVNLFGYPALVAKLATFILAGLWLVINHTDHRAHDYPLIRYKYRFLHIVTAMLCLASILQAGYFFDMAPEVITSCCGSLFNEENRTVAGEISGLPPGVMQVLLYTSAAVTFRQGLSFYVTGKSARSFSRFSNWLFLLAFASVISFICLYYYELPTHHCPFCVLHREYGYIGYPLYLSLLVGGIAGMSIRMIDRARTAPTLKGIVPLLQKRLCAVSLVCYLVFLAMAVYPFIFSDFRLEGS